MFPHPPLPPQHLREQLGREQRQELFSFAAANCLEVRGARAACPGPRRAHPSFPLASSRALIPLPPLDTPPPPQQTPPPPPPPPPSPPPPPPPPPPPHPAPLHPPPPPPHRQLGTIERLALLLSQDTLARLSYVDAAVRPFIADLAARVAVARAVGGGRS
jgi:hypothetical protein